MPYRNIQFAQGEYYHIYNRGAGGQLVFRERDDYLCVLRLVEKYTNALDITAIAYCLLPDHYHFLLRQDGEQRAGLLPQRNFSSYSKSFNSRYDGSGTLFEGRYKALHVDKEDYVLHLCRYIHANPVKHGLVSSLKEWPYSNYHEWIGTRSGTLVDRAFVRGHFPSEPDPKGLLRPLGSYGRFVQDYLAGLDGLPEGIEAYLLESLSPRIRNPRLKLKSALRRWGVP
jgi:putative transposase